MKTHKTNRLSTSALFWALLFIGVAVVLLLDALHLSDTLLPADLSFWRILAGFVTAWGLVWGARERSPFAIIFALAGEVILFDRWILHAMGSDRQEVASVKMMLLIALLLSIGFSILKNAWRSSHPNWHNATGEDVAAYVTSKVGGGIKGNATQYFDCTEPFHSSVENNLGSTNIFFSNTEAYRGDSSLRVENNLGALILHVPEDWLVEAEIENSLGAVIVPASSCANPEKKLQLRGENNLGSITVKYVQVADIPTDSVE